MVSTVETQLPILDFSEDLQKLVKGSDRWEILSSQVKQAFEEYGCFQVTYNKISTSECEEAFKELKELFGLPDDTKEKNISNKAFHGYIRTNLLPLYESFGIEDAHMNEGAQAFTDLMWPDGNLSFCQTVNSISIKIFELKLTVLKMLMGSYGAEKYFASYVESHNTVLRVMEYKVPDSNVPEIGLPCHKDINSLTILCQNSVQGLEVQTKDGKWFQVAMSPDSFIIIVGSSLRVWSNGRLHAPNHRVMMSGDKIRYSLALFSKPRDGIVIEVPKELVDKDNPLLYRPFNYLKFVHFKAANPQDENPLESFSRIFS